MKFLPRFTNGEHLYGNNDAIPFSNPRRAYLLEIILKKKENRSEYSETKFFQTHPQGFLNFARILCYNYVKIAVFSTVAKTFAWHTECGKRWKER